MNSGTPPLLSVRDLCVRYGAQDVLRDISFDIVAGETLGLVGESGSGKTSLARAIVGLVRPAGGMIEFSGLDLAKSRPEIVRAQRRDLQMIFQDPFASLNPRMTALDIIGEPLKIFEPEMPAIARHEKICRMLERVGLDAAAAPRYPHAFSGGQCQRIGIARAAILRPKLLICDEAVSSLDVSIQGQIINLLADLQREMGMAMLFISHNLAAVRHASHRVMVICAGRLVETASTDALFSAPGHPYTRTLLAAVPRLP